MSQKCPIWGTPAEVRRARDRHAFRVRSSRTDGDYEITGQAAATIEAGTFDDRAKAKLTTMLIEQRREGVDCPLVDSALLEEIRNAPILADNERAENLLRYISSRESSIHDSAARIGYPIIPEALAHSESWEDRQVDILVHYMEGAAWVNSVRTLDSIACNVTGTGHKHLEGLTKSAQGSQAFVAMWFNSETDQAYQHGIAPAIRDAGFIPMRIDE